MDGTSPLGRLCGVFLASASFVVAFSIQPQLLAHALTDNNLIRDTDVSVITMILSLNLVESNVNLLEMIPC